MVMDTKDLQVEISILLDEMEGDQGDSHEVYLRIRQLLRNLEATGMPLPEDLVRLERELDAQFAADKAGGA